MFRHPSYYKKLRERNKSDRAISSQKTVDVGDSVRPGLGHKQQATSSKPQAPSASSHKPQASSPVAKASSFKPQASSALIPEPGNK
jgi:hypothetical protein